MSRPTFLQPLLRRSVGAATLRNTRSGRELATVLETAFESAERRRGLLGREGLPAGHALIIAPTSLVHTFSMKFAIDIVFVARNGRVVKVRRAVPPGRIAGALGAFAVVELAAGGTDPETRAGDVLEVITG